MKKFTILLLLPAAIILSESFTTSKTLPQLVPAGCKITIDDAPFAASANRNYSAMVINGGKTASIVLPGEDLHDKQGQVYPTNLQIDYTLRDDALGEVRVEKVSYEYNNKKYNLVPASAFMSITKMKWNADKRSAVMCADIYFKVKMDYRMEEFVPVLIIRGQLRHLVIASPAS